MKECVKFQEVHHFKFVKNWRLPFSSRGLSLGSTFSVIINILTDKSCSKVYVFLKYKLVLSFGTDGRKELP